MIMAKKVCHAAAALTKDQNRILIGGFPAVEPNFKPAPPPLEGLQILLPR
jgi:hypothetical protein